MAVAILVKGNKGQGLKSPQLEGLGPLIDSVQASAMLSSVLQDLFIVQIFLAATTLYLRLHKRKIY